MLKLLELLGNAFQVKEHLEIFAELKGVNPNTLDSVVSEMVDEVSS